MELCPKLDNLSLFGGNAISNGSNTSSQSSSSSESSSGEQTSSSAKNGIENIGLAVFSQDKLVGKLTASETLCYLMLDNQVKSCNISIPDSNNQDDIIDLYFNFENPAKIDVSILNDSPYVTVKLKANAKISSVKKLSVNTTNEEIKRIGTLASNYLSRQILHYLYKTSKELNADTSSIGKYALSEFKTMPEFEEYSWANHYQDSFFKVETEVIVDSGFLLTGA